VRQTRNHDLMLLLNCGLSLIVIFYQADRLFGAVGVRKLYGLGVVIIPLIIGVIFWRVIWSDWIILTPLQKARLVVGLFVLYLVICGVGSFVGYLIGYIVLNEDFPGVVSLIPLLLSILVWVFQPRWSFGLSVMLVPITFICTIWIGLGYWVHYDIVSEMGFEGRYYFLEVENTASDGDFFEVYECNPYAVGCESIYRSWSSMRETHYDGDYETIYQESILAVRNNLLVVLSGKSTLYTLYR